MFYRNRYNPRPGDYNRNGRLSYEAILQILETAAGDHSRSAGDGIAGSYGTGIAWILTEWRIDIIRRPKSEEALNITTWVRGKAMGGKAYRDFVVKDDGGAELIHAEAQFALFDLKTSRLTRISEELLSSYRPETRELFEPPAKLRTPDEYSSQSHLELRRSDIDFNGHVHNTRYADYALQAISDEKFENDAFSSVRILYKKPLIEGADVILRLSSEDAREVIGIYDGDTLCCLVELALSA